MTTYGHEAATQYATAAVDGSYAAAVRPAAMSGTPGEVRDEMVDGLAALVRFVEQLPAELVADALRYAFDRINVWSAIAEPVLRLARAGVAAGAVVTRERTLGVDGGAGFDGVMITFKPGVRLHIYTDWAKMPVAEPGIVHLPEEAQQQ